MSALRQAHLRVGMTDAGTALFLPPGAQWPWGRIPLFPWVLLTRRNWAAMMAALGAPPVFDLQYTA